MKAFKHLHRGAALAFLLLSLLLTACGVNAEKAIEPYASEEIVISGLLEEDFTITPADLLQLECVERTATGRSEKAGTVTAYGPLLETFLAQYGASMADFHKIRFICADDYRAVLKNEYLTDGYEVVLCVSYGSDPLPEDMRPLRLLIPEGESNKWAYAVTRIEFEYDE